MENKNIILLFIIVLIIGIAYGIYFFTKTPSAQGLNPDRISQEVSKGEATLLDVRTQLELEQEGFATGAIHFDSTRIQNNELPAITPKDQKIYIYCKSGARAGKAKTTLENNGYTNVENIGGLRDWINAGGEVTK